MTGDHAGHVPDDRGDLTAEQHRDRTGHTVMITSAEKKPDTCWDCPWTSADDEPARPVEDRDLPPWSLVPTDAVCALLDALGVQRGPNDITPEAFEQWRAALGAALPYADRAAYRRGFDKGETGAIDRFTRSGLIVGPDDYLVIGIGGNPSLDVLDRWGSALVDKVPALAGRVVVSGAEHMAVIQHAPPDVPLTPPGGQPRDDPAWDPGTATYEQMVAERQPEGGQ